LTISFHVDKGVGGGGWKGPTRDRGTTWRAVTKGWVGSLNGGPSHKNKLAKQRKISLLTGGEKKICARGTKEQKLIRQIWAEQTRAQTEPRGEKGSGPAKWGIFQGGSIQAALTVKKKGRTRKEEVTTLGIRGGKIKNRKQNEKWKTRQGKNFDLY